jgi:hypothetical protein
VSGTHRKYKATVCLFARLLFGLSYSLTLLGLLRDYGPNQREK